MMGFLRWLNSLRTRALDDFRKELMRQQWWDLGVVVDRHCLVFVDKNAKLQIGEGSVIGPYTILHLQNDPASSEQYHCQLTIGKRTAINEFCNIRASGGEIHIGDGCLLAQFVTIIATNHGIAAGDWIRDQPWDLSKRTVRIGTDVWIGAGATILPGVTIGDGSVVAAGAVVTKDVPSNTIVAGVPALAVSSRY